MCGIVGLHIKVAARERELGALLAPMLGCMATRGADSAGLAILSDPVEIGRYRYSVRLSDEAVDDVTTRAETVAKELAAALGQEVICERARPDGLVLMTIDDPELVTQELLRLWPESVVMGYGRALEIVKAVGTPQSMCEQFDVSGRSGYTAIGHTRMATESAVTTDGSHPFAPTHDLAIVHNGSFSNPSTVRRRLEEQGITCVTANDTEVAARLIGLELSRGSGIEVALKEVGRVMDGFYTLLVATDREIAVVRDSFACKPMVVAETDDYVAFASEYIAMTGLPGIESARVFEPKPEEIHVWER